MKPHASNMFLAIATATLALMAIDAIVFGIHPGGLTWRFVLANLLTATTLAYVAWAASRSQARGRALFVAVLVLYFAISYINTMDEGVFFMGLAAKLVVGALVVGLVRSLAVAGALAKLLGGTASEDHEPVVQAAGLSWGAWLWRLIAGDLAYVFLYFAAGMTVFPFVKEFYATMPMPKPSSVVLMQLLRALIYIGAALPAIRLIRHRGHAALALGLAFSILGGVAPLLPDNPLMPPNIRFAHSIEIGVSNFIFGVVLAYLFTPRPAPAPRLADGQAVLT